MAVRRKDKTKSRNTNASGRLFLGVDGGGTKTQVVLIDRSRNIVAEGFAGASNPMRVGTEEAIENILRAITVACDKAGQAPEDIAAAALGLAGVRRKDLNQLVRARFKARTRIKSVQVLTDAEIALYGGVEHRAGVVVIAGTGSICLGQNDAGEKALAGGWGPLAGDEGGGAGIARKALQAIARASDKRGRQTTLSGKATEYFRAGTAEDLIVAIYSPQMDNSKIAGFSRFVAEAAAEGDRTAIEILADAGRELGIAANAVIRRLKLEQTKFPVVKVGGVFRAGELMTRPLIETINNRAPKAFLIEPPLQPAVAAAHLALEIYKAGAEQIREN